MTLVRRIPDRPLIPEKDVHLVSDRGFRALRFLREASIVEGLGGSSRRLLIVSGLYIAVIH